MSADRTVSSMPRFGTALLHPRYWLQWLALALFYLFSMMPMAVIDSVAHRLGGLFYRINQKRVRFANINLKMCFPEMEQAERERLVREHFQHQMRSVMHYGLVWWASRRRLQSMVEIQGQEIIESCRQQGRNVIALTSHSVGLEFSVGALGLYHECSGPYKPMKNPLVDWLVARGRTRFGVRAYTRDEGLRPIIKDTKQGRVMIYLADEDLGADKSVFADFFAAKKATIPVLARLAKQCNASVVPCTSCYDTVRRKYIVHLYDALDDFESHDEQASAENMNRAVERTVKQCVAQYFWTLRLFKTRPEGEAPVYAK